MRRIGELLGRCSLVLLVAAPVTYLPTAQAEEQSRLAVTDTEQAVSGASDLLQLYQQAQTQDPRILAAQAAARRAGHQQREALGRLLPQMNADARLTRTNYISAPEKPITVVSATLHPLLRCSMIRLSGKAFSARAR